MSVIPNLTGHTEDYTNYTTIDHKWIDEWIGYGVALNSTPPHSELSYGNVSSYSEFCNIFVIPSP